MKKSIIYKKIEESGTMDHLKLPKYSIPVDLQIVLDQKVKACSLSTRARNFSLVLAALTNEDYIDISENHYLLLLKFALYLEEHKSMSDMIKNKLSSRKIERFTSKKVEEQRRLKLFQIGVGDTIEDKLFIKPGDFIDLSCTSENYKVYSLRVTDVTQTHIIANDEDEKLHETFTPHKKYQVQFRFDNYYMRCAHLALWLMRERNSLTYLFPLKSKPFVKDITVYSHDFKTFNTAIESNAEQKEAVSNIVNRSCFPVPYILYGPTGTGKTTTLVEAICQVFHCFPDNNILVCTPSDTGADKITKMLLKFMLPKDIYRVYNQYRNSIDEEIQNCANYVDGEITYPKYEDVVKKRIIITTLCDCMSLLLIGIEATYFSHVIIDEVGRATDPDVLIPVSLVSEDGKLHSQIVLAGDPQQLGPTVKSKIAKTILGRSILERIMPYEIYQKDSNNKYNSKYITKLLQHYRSHPDIIHVSNELFYDNELISKCERSANERFRVIFNGVGGKEKEAHSNSIYNMVELNVVMNYVDDLLDNGLGMGKVAMEDIGIITPFAFQSKKIQKELRYEKLKAIKVGTIDLFLNDERKIMIMTTTKSKMFAEKGSEHMKILSDARRFNIAMTRARELLIVVGNPNVLQVDNKWRYLIKFCLDNKSYEGMKFSLGSRSINAGKAPTTSAIVNTSKLFDIYVLTLFTIDDYNPDINPHVTKDSLLHSRYKNIISPAGNSHSSDDKTDDNFASDKNASDQVEPNPRDVSENVENLDVTEFICMDTPKNYCKIRKPSIENDIFDNIGHSSIIKHSLDELNNLLQGNVSQNVSQNSQNNSVRTKLGDPSNFKKPADRQDLLFETDSSGSGSHYGHIEFQNSSAVKSSHDQQTNVLKGGDLKSNCDFAKNSDSERKSVIKSSLPENIGHFNYAKSADLGFATTSMDDQKDLIDFDCVIKIDDVFNLIEFEDIPKDSNNVPRKFDILESDYVNLL